MRVQIFVRDQPFLFFYPCITKLTSTNFWTKVMWASAEEVRAKAKTEAIKELRMNTIVVFVLENGGRDGKDDEKKNVPFTSALFISFR